MTRCRTIAGRVGCAKRGRWGRTRSKLASRCRVCGSDRRRSRRWSGTARGDVTVSPSDEQFLRDAVGRRDIEVLYDEFDAADTHWVHRFLFWPYQEVSVHFGAFTLAVTPAPGRFEIDEAESDASMKGNDDNAGDFSTR